MALINHDEMLVELNRFIELVENSGFDYFISVGKEGVGSSFIGGRSKDVIARLSDLADRKPEVKGIFKECSR